MAPSFLLLDKLSAPSLTSAELAVVPPPGLIDKYFYGDSLTLTFIGRTKTY